MRSIYVFSNVHVMSDEALAPVALMKSLADETRLKILMLIEQQRDLCVCELCCALELSQPKVSRHLARLRADGLVKDRRQGQWVFYQIAPLPGWVQQALVAASLAHPQFLKSCNKRLDAMGDRPERLRKLCCE